MFKKVFAALLCVVTLGLTQSCSKETEDLLLGKWRLIAVDEDFSKAWEYTIEFLKKGEFKLFNKPDHMEGYYKLDGKNLILYDIQNVGGNGVSSTDTVLLESLTENEMMWILPNYADFNTFLFEKM